MEASGPLGGRRQRRSAERAAGSGDADEDEDEADDDRERAEKLEAIEHGEVCWGGDDAYFPGLAWPVRSRSAKKRSRQGGGNRSFSATVELKMTSKYGSINSEGDSAAIVHTLCFDSDGSWEDCALDFSDGGRRWRPLQSPT